MSFHDTKYFRNRRWTTLAIFFCLSIILIIPMAAQEFLSVEELRLNFKQLNIEEFAMKSLVADGNDKPMGMMKILEFDNERFLFIGAKNKLVKIPIDEQGRLNVSSIQVHNFTDPVKPFPDTYRNVSGDTEMQDFFVYLTSYDTCLSYRERHLSRNVTIPTDDGYFRSYYEVSKVPGNNRPLQNWIRFEGCLEEAVCRYNYIRGIQDITVSHNGSNISALWVCGTFSSFPKAILLDPKTMELLDPDVYPLFDTNVMSCARWPDEAMTTFFDNGQLYVASGWGLYKPDMENPDIPYNNSTMLYSDWKMLWNGYHWPTRMAMVLGRDVRFISRVIKTKHYLYFFGHEINPQYSYINSLTRQAYQSFMLRICRNDTGFNYTASEDMNEIFKYRGDLMPVKGFFISKFAYPNLADETAFSYSSESWGDTHHFPTKHFTSAVKFPFGCYLKRYDGSQSMNIFWGEQNIVYFNRLADVALSFKWTNEMYFYGVRNKFTSDYFLDYFLSKLHSYNMDPILHIYNWMVGAFSSTGFTPKRRYNGWEGPGTVRPIGAVCQFHLSEWKTDNYLYDRDWPLPANAIQAQMNGTKEKKWESNLPKNQRQYTFQSKEVQTFYRYKIPVSELNMKQEFYSLYATMQNSFFTRGHIWFEGMQMPNFTGLDFIATPVQAPEWREALKDAMECGKCRTPEQMKNMTKTQFEKLMNHSSMAWPTDWFSYLSKFYDAFFHMNPVSVAGDNASFVLYGVEFMKMIVLEQNFTKYQGGNASQPLIYMVLISTDGDVYRVVMCDLVSYSLRHATCEMRNTDQPYITIDSMTMRINDAYRKDNVKHKQKRVSSLLSKWRLVDARDSDEDEMGKLDPQSPLLKDARFDNKTNMLLLLTSSRLRTFNLTTEAVCSTYTKCVDCASDPMCGWTDDPVVIGAGNCTPFVKGRKQTQDVLGRGERCFPVHASVPEINIALSSNETASLQCNMSSFFRGPIFWRYTEVGDAENWTRVDEDDEDDELHSFGSQQTLYISRRDEQKFHYQCFGLKFDDRSAKVTLGNYLVHWGVSNMTGDVYCPYMYKVRDHYPNANLDSNCTTSTNMQYNSTQDLIDKYCG